MGERRLFWIQTPEFCLREFLSQGCKMKGTSTTIKKLHEGYALPALMVMTTLILVVLTSAEISWQKRMQRAREEELIFRGKQYMRAIMLFQRKTGAYPTSIEALLNTNNMHFLRKVWLDPITNSDDWRWIRLTPDAPLMRNLGGGGTSGRDSSSTTSGRQSSSSMSGQSVFGSASSGGPNSGSPNIGQTSASGGGFSGQRSRGGTGLMMYPIIGVASKSPQKSLKTFNNQTQYDHWEFIYLPGMNISWSIGPGSVGLGGLPPGSAPPSGNLMPGSNQGLGRTNPSRTGLGGTSSGDNVFK